MVSPRYPDGSSSCLRPIRRHDSCHTASGRSTGPPGYRQHCRGAHSEQTPRARRTGGGLSNDTQVKWTRTPCWARGDQVARTRDQNRERRTLVKQRCETASSDYNISSPVLPAQAAKVERRLAVRTITVRAEPLHNLRVISLSVAP